MRRACIRSFSSSKADGASLLKAARAGAMSANEKKTSPPVTPPLEKKETAEALKGPVIESVTPTFSARPLVSSFVPFHEFCPKICVIGVGGAGGNAVNNMISRGLQGVEFLVCNTDAQHLATSLTTNCIQLGRETTQGLGCGANPDAGKIAAAESCDEIMEFIEGSHMAFITAGLV
mmetsp:Transcript_54202/g.93370  ORF Transcript_54202/g.93370 Transcript_54202/m.93370 type:complete len:176 (-) Transcript_54202:5-532(-)